MKRWTTFFGFLVAGFFLIPHGVFAATLYIDPNHPIAYRADSITLAVRLDTDKDECANTVDAVINYDPSILAVDVSRGNSILSLWVQEPKIDEIKHQITFAGGIPNGYCGRIPGDPQLTNILAELVFRIPGFTVGGASGDTANVSFAPESRVLLNDGLGTNAPLQTYGATITLKSSAGTSIADDWQTAVANDKTPPEQFSINLIQQNNVFSGKHYIAWSTTDKQTGIDHYEVYEEPIKDLEFFHWGEPDRVWTKAQSPYVLHDQFLRSVIRVKAIDKAGNERIATYAPSKAEIRVNPLQVAFYAAIGVGVLILFALIVYLLVGFIRKRKAKETPEHEDSL